MHSGEWIQLSPSSINVVEDCPRCGWRQFRGVPRPRGIFPSLPGGIDLIVKRELDKHRERGEWPPLLKDQKLPGKPLLRPPRSKLAYADPALKVRLVGFLDDAYEVDGRVGPLDFKTRGSKPEDVHPAYQRQMTLYHLLLAANGWTPTGMAVLVYLFPVEGHVDGGIPFDVDVKEVKTDEGKARSPITSAAKIVRGPMPPPSPDCEFCKSIENVARLERAGARGGVVA